MLIGIDASIRDYTRDMESALNALVSAAYFIYVHTLQAVIWLLLVLFSPPVFLTIIGFSLILMSYKRSRKVTDTVIPTIRAATQGKTILKGRVVSCGAPLKGPGSGQACVAYRIDVEGDRAGYINIEKHFQNFLIDDGTSRCLVLLSEYPKSAHRRYLELVSSSNVTRFMGVQQENGHVTLAPAILPKRTIVESLQDAWRGTQVTQYLESAIYVDDEVYVEGYFKTERDPTLLPIGKESVKSLLTAWNQDRAAFVEQFDQNGDGKLDKDEVRTAAQVARAELETERARFEFDPHEQPEIHTMQAADGSPVDVRYRPEIHNSVVYTFKQPKSDGQVINLTCTSCGSIQGDKLLEVKNDRTKSAASRYCVTSKPP